MLLIFFCFFFFFQAEDGIRDRDVTGVQTCALPILEADRSRLVEENTKLRHELKERYQIRSLIGNSRPMQQLYDQVAQVAPSSTTVLVRGESGTGKEMVEHAIHYGSPRAERT